jgi:hypothetical protein
LIQSSLCPAALVSLGAARDLAGAMMTFGMTYGKDLGLKWFEAGKAAGSTHGTGSSDAS